MTEPHYARQTNCVLVTLFDRQVHFTYRVWVWENRQAHIPEFREVLSDYVWFAP